MKSDMSRFETLETVWKKINEELQSNEKTKDV